MLMREELHNHFSIKFDEIKKENNKINNINQALILEIKERDGVIIEIEKRQKELNDEIIKQVNDDLSKKKKANVNEDFFKKKNKCQ